MLTNAPARDLQNGDLCFYKYGRADDSECNIKCRRLDEKTIITGNAFDSCGGRWRNLVYAGKYRYIVINGSITQM